MDLRKIFNFIPEVTKPSDKKVDFNTKLKWTLIILIAFFVLANYIESHSFVTFFKIGFGSYFLL